MEQKKNVNIFEVWETKVYPIFRKVIRFWYIPLILSGAAFAWAYSTESAKKPVFSSRITFMLEDDILSDGQQVGAGSQLLMALSGQRTQSNKAVMVDLSLSNKLVEESLVRTVTIDSQKVVLANYFMDHCGFREQWKKDKNAELAAFRFPENYIIGSDTKKDYWLRVFSNNIKLSLKSIVMESGLIVMTYSSNHELFTKTFLETHLSTISEFYINKKVERAVNLMKFARRKRDSLLAALTGRSYGLAAMQDQGFGTVMRRAKVQEMQVSRDIGIINQQYNESVAALSSASIDLERQKPFISVVDDIRLPLDGTWPKPLNKGFAMAVIALLLGFAAIAGVVFGLDYLKTQQSEFRKISHHAP